MLQAANLPQDALKIFSTASKKRPITIQVAVGMQELCTLHFNIDDMNQPDHLMHRTVGATVTAMLDQLHLVKETPNPSAE